MDVGKSVYVIGQEGILEELDLAGISHKGGPSDNGKQAVIASDTTFRIDPDIGAVIVGLDTGINYYKLQYAQLCLNTQKDCIFIATNMDAVTHLTSEQEW